jgi:hypothetical protein
LLQAASGILRPSTDDESNKTATDEHLIASEVTREALRTAPSSKKTA